MTLGIPAVPPALPRRGNALSHWLGRRMLGAIGWRIDGDLPDLPKLVAIVAPHTSSWDFLVGVIALFALGVRVTFLGKDALFGWPLGAVMRWLGGIPVDRVNPSGIVERIIAEFNRRNRMVLALAPEGTRKKVTRWRTGFYYIAVGARVPIVPIAFDWATRTIRIGPPIVTTGRLEDDMQTMAAFYAGVRGKRPELATLRSPERTAP
jgi:1-acyl-sn-glycerol-3-phosphate acyltransferase